MSRWPRSVLMRAVILPLLLTAVLVAAGAAVAGGPRTHADDGKATAAAHRGNATADHDDGETNRTWDRENRTAARESFAENRTALMETFVARLQSVRASWLENATKVREDCHVDDESAKHCVRDGYRSWREAHRVEMKELRAELRALFDSWHAGRRASD